MLGKRALAGPDSSAVAAEEVAVATAAGAILRAGRGWGAETGGGEAAGRIQSCGAVGGGGHCVAQEGVCRGQCASGEVGSACSSLGGMDS